MSKKKLPIEETKVKISITLSRELNRRIEKINQNKSKIIETILSKYIDRWED